jgi:hypothetical protein
MGKKSRQKKISTNMLLSKDGIGLNTAPSSRKLITNNDTPKAVSKNTTIMLVIIVVFAFGVYFNALYNGFVYDDELQVLENPWIKDVRHLPDIFSKSVWSFYYVNAANYYRPLMHVIYMLNYYVFGLTPWGFHLVNILFHVANTVLIFIIGKRLLVKSIPTVMDRDLAFFSIPFLSAILFATHPIHTEAVVWIGGITDLSFTFFVLLSFYFFIKSESVIGNRQYVFSIFSFFIALLCKEPAVMLIVIFMAYDFVFWKEKNNLSSRIKMYIPFLVIVGVYFIIRHHALGRFTPEKAYSMSIFQYIGSMVHIFAHPHSTSKCNTRRSDFKRCFKAQTLSGAIIDQ